MSENYHAHCLPAVLYHSENRKEIEGLRRGLTRAVIRTKAVQMVTRSRKKWRKLRLYKLQCSRLDPMQSSYKYA